ncbi:MAG: recombinase family protein [Planctomycetia bacterium]|nr:recombinase family protein [Planctomycetia bacterium]
MSVVIVPQNALADNSFDDVCSPWIRGRGLFGDCGGIARVSTRDQFYGGTSLPAQQDEIENVAVRYHANLERVISVVESNTDGPGPELQKAFDYVQEQGLTLIACSLDRVTKQDLDSTGGERDIYVIVSELGRIVDRKEVLSDAYRQRQRSIATKRSMQFLKRQGKHVGRPFKQKSK